MSTLSSGDPGGESAEQDEPEAAPARVGSRLGWVLSLVALILLGGVAMELRERERRGAERQETVRTRIEGALRLTLEDCADAIRAQFLAGATKDMNRFRVQDLRKSPVASRFGYDLASAHWVIEHVFLDEGVPEDSGGPEVVMTNLTVWCGRRFGHAEPTILLVAHGTPPCNERFLKALRGRLKEAGLEFFETRGPKFKDLERNEKSWQLLDRLAAEKRK